jgi:hypothetical protein
LYPTTEETSLQASSTTCCGGAVPVPVKFSKATFDALLAKVPVAETLPEACGLKVNVKGTLCPAARVRGKVIPLSENSVLLKLIDEIETLETLAVSIPD